MRRGSTSSPSGKTPGQGKARVDKLHSVQEVWYQRDEQQEHNVEEGHGVRLHREHRHVGGVDDPGRDEDQEREHERGDVAVDLPGGCWQLTYEDQGTYPQGNPEYQVGQRFDSGPGSPSFFLQPLNKREIRIRPFGDRTRRRKSKEK